MALNHINLKFHQLRDRKEYIVTGLEEGQMLVTPKLAKDLQLASQAGRLFPFQVVDWVQHEGTGEPCVLLTFRKTFDTKIWGFDE